MRYATVTTWARELEIGGGGSLIQKRLESQNKVGIVGMSRAGVRRTFYKESDVYEVTTDLLKELPQVDEYGFVEVNENEFGTITSWAKRISVTGRTIYLAVKENGVKGIEGRDIQGKICRLYSKDDIYRVCMSHAEDLPRAAGEDGFIYLNNERHGTLRGWERKLSISEARIKTQLEKFSVKGIRGKGKGGQVGIFYPETDVRKVCDYYLKNYPQSTDGFIEVGVERYGTARALAQILNKSSSGVLLIIRRNSLGGIKGKNLLGRIQNFYSESVVRELYKRKFLASIASKNETINITDVKSCEEEVAIKHSADENGYFSIEGESYRSTEKWAEKFGIGDSTVRKKLKKAKMKGLEAKDVHGRISNYYSESEVRSACEKNLEELTQMDDGGFFVKDNQRFGTLYAWVKILPVASRQLIKQRLNKAGIKGVKARDVHSVVRRCYSEADVRAVCADQLEELPKADESGFFEKNGVRYGTNYTFRSVIGISYKVIMRIIRSSDMQAIKGRDKQNKKCDFYSEEEVRSICAHFLRNFPQADESGFFEKDGVRFGTLSAYVGLFGYSQPAVKARVKKYGLVPVDGRAQSGHVIKFYAEPDMLRACADLLKKRQKPCLPAGRSNPNAA